jgi:hypothetical protein
MAATSQGAIDKKFSFDWCEMLDYFVEQDRLVIKWSLLISFGVNCETFHLRCRSTRQEPGIEAAGHPKVGRHRG